MAEQRDAREPLPILRDRARVRASPAAVRVKRALITGITGRTARIWPSSCSRRATRCTASSAAPRPSTPAGSITSTRIPHEAGRRLILHYGDLNDASSLNRTLRIVDPDEIYNLGAQSHVKVSFDMPEYTGEVTGLGSVRLLEAIRELAASGRGSTRRPRPRCSAGRRRCRRTRRRPSTRAAPTRAAKVYAYWMTVNYREAYGLFAVNGILFNHESPRRGETFVSRKITRAVGRIAARAPGPPLPRQPRRAARLGLREGLRRGDVADAPAARDPDDYVVATGESHTVREFCESALRARRLASSTGGERARREGRGSTADRAACSSRSTRRTCVRPRSTTCAATPRAPASGSAGRRRVDFDGPRRR